MLELSLGHYQEAARRAFRAHKEPPVLTLASEVDVMVESAARCGDREAASSVLEAFASRAQACGTHWALGLLARSRALLAADEDAEADYRLAIDHLRQCRIAPQLARSYQLYGEWLRRQRRRREARDQLRTAGQMFEAMDMDRFAERARAELLATGERARRRSVETEQVLTPRRRRSAAWPARALRTGRSPPGCSSAPPPSNTTCVRSTLSSASPAGYKLVHALPAREGA